MIIDKNNNNPTEKRVGERRSDSNRRESVRFGDALGRRAGIDRRANVHIKPG